MKLADLPEYLQLPSDQELTAQELETMIVKLMVLRANIAPPVHAAPPSTHDADQRAPVAVVKDPEMNLASLNNGAIRLWLRHPGLGWVPFQMSAQRAGLLRDYLVNWVEDNSAAKLIAEREAGGYLLH